jgi:2,4-dienoyl-CoA reductase (NADPH2)
VTLLQRKATPIGIGLGKTSGWAHRAHLKQDGVKQVRGATYDKIEAGDDSLTLHYAVDGEPRTLEVDHVILCAGQESVRNLWPEGESALKGAKENWHLIGGADVAAELDAKRAIRQGTEVAAGL